MVIKAEHTFNRAILAGAGGGLAMIAAMFYPLYVHWPGLFVEGWTTGSSTVSYALSALAVLIVPVTGYVAARWARVGRRAAGTLVGALSGWIAALTAYVILVGPASGVAASRAIFYWGVRPALGDAHALWLTAEPVINAVYTTYITLWVMQIGGLALGALGGAFAPASSGTVAAPELRSAAATFFQLASFVYAQTLIVAPVIFYALQGSLTGDPSYSSTGTPLAEAVKPYVFSLAPEGVGLIPTGTALLLLALSMAVLYLIRSAQRRAGDTVELTGGAGLSVVVALLPVVSALTLLVVGSSRLGVEMTMVGVATCAVLAVLFVVQAVGDFRRRQPGEPLFAEWNPLISLVFFLTLIFVLGILGRTIFVPFVSYYDWTWLPIGVLTLIAVWLIPAGAYWWFVIRPKGITFKAWLTSHSRGPLVRSPHQFSNLWQGTLNVISAGFPLSLLIMSQVISATLSMVLLVVPTIVVIYSYEADPLLQGSVQAVQNSPAELVQNLYLVHAQALGIATLVSFVLIGVVLLILRGWKALVGRMVARATPDADQPEAG